MKAMVELWEAPIQTLSRAGRAFEGLEALLGGENFDLQADPSFLPHSVAVLVCTTQVTIDNGPPSSDTTMLPGRVTCGGGKGWAQMDRLRERLEDLKELRDLVRSLGRGGGWGPLRRAPVQA